MKPDFKKIERINSKREINKLFSEGKPLFIYPFKLRYLPTDFPFNKILITIPKKSFGKAVDRNLLKRRIREAYRLNKHKFNSKNFDIIFIYVSKDLLNYDLIESKLLKVIDRLNK